MKKLLFGLLVFGSIPVFASDYYNCEAVHNYHGSQYAEDNPREELVIKRGVFNDEIKSIKLIDKISMSELENVANPFAANQSYYYRITNDIREESKKHKFKRLWKKIIGPDTAITLSESLLRGEKVGFAEYYVKHCLFTACTDSSFYYKCSK